MGTENTYYQENQMAQTRVLGVDYRHLILPDGDDLYLTAYGLPFLDNLLPANFWSDGDWFKDHSERLKGTSTLYRITTKKSQGKSKEIVLK